MSIFNTLCNFFGKQPDGRKSKRCNGSWRPRFEQLESRQMLSITPGEFPNTGDDFDRRSAGY